jgi:hypothetical protein
LKTTVQKEDRDPWPLLAVGWHDCKLKTFIASRGHTQRGSDSIRLRHAKVDVERVQFTERRVKSVKRPNVVELLCKYFSAVDIHDHLIQGSLNMEESWETKTWWHRIFATMLGVIFADCYFAFKFHSGLCNLNSLSFTDFLCKLAHSLIFNCDINTRVPINVPNEPMEGNVGFGHCRLINLYLLPQYQKLRGTTNRARLHCKFKNCPTKQLVNYFCVACSFIVGDEIVPFAICNDCFSLHSVHITSVVDRC